MWQLHKAKGLRVANSFSQLLSLKIACQTHRVLCDYNWILPFIFDFVINIGIDDVFVMLCYAVHFDRCLYL